MTKSDRSRATTAGPADDPVPTEVPTEIPVVIPLEIKAVVVAAVVVGIGLRFVARSPLWLDEALSVNIAKLPLGQIPEALRHDGHPPLYYALLHVWMQLFGEGDATVRSLSGLISVATLPFAYLTGRRVGGRALGWILLGVTALSPFVLRYATETRMYSLIVLLVFVGYLLTDDLVRRGRATWWRVVALAAVVAGLLYSHYWAMWLLAGAGVVLLITWRRSPDPARRAGAWRALVALVAGGVTFLPWLPTLLYQSKHTGTPWAGPVRPTSLVASTLTDFGGGDFKDAQFVGAVLLLLCLLAVFGVARSTRHIDLDLHTTTRFRAEAAVIVLTIGIALAVSYATGSAFATRYASTFLPLVLLLTAGGIVLFTGRWVRFGALVVVLGLCALGCYTNLTTDRTQAKVIAAQVAKVHQPDDLVVYCPDQLGPAALRVMPTDVRSVAFPTMDRPDRVDWVDYVARNSADPAAYADQVLEAAGSTHGIFLVWSTGYKTHQGTCEALVAALGAKRSPAQTLVGEDGDRYYEHANLTYFPPPG